MRFTLTRLPFRFAILLALGGFFIAGVLKAGEPNPPEGFRALFDGKSLDEWHGNNPHQTTKAPAEEREQAITGQQEDFLAHWRVENGELVNDGHGPYATTEDEFGDIELHIEYKTVAKADSGIYLRGTPQVQIWDYTEAGGKWDRGANKGSGGLHNNSADAPGHCRRSWPTSRLENGIRFASPKLAAVRPCC